MMSNKRIREIINEELTKTEVTSMIKRNIDSSLSSRDFEKRVKEISATVINELFKILWQRNSFWKNGVKS